MVTVAILVVFFVVQRFGTDKIGYTFAPVVVIWLLLIGGIGIYDLIKYDIGTMRAFDPIYIIHYFQRNKKKGWVSLGEILLCFTGTEALFADLGYFSIKSIQHDVQKKKTAKGASATILVDKQQRSTFNWLATNSIAVDKING